MKSMVSEIPVGLQEEVEVAFFGPPPGFSDEYAEWQMNQGPWGDRSWGAFRRYLDQRGEVG